MKRLFSKIDYYNIILAFLLSRLFFLIIIKIANTDFETVCSLFDAEHYRHIAYTGYTEPITAFFPIVPILIRIFGDTGIIIINNTAFLISMFILYKLLDEKQVCPLYVYAFSPISFYSMIEYTEALFMFFTILSFYLFVKRRFGIIFGIVLGLCSATRNVGSMLFFAIFIGIMILWYKKEIKIVDIFKTYIPATIISCLYPLYLQINFGNWKLFLDVQYDYWIRIDTNIFNTFKEQLDIITNDAHYSSSAGVLYRFNEQVTIAIGFVFIILLIITMKKQIITMKNKCYDENFIVAMVYAVASILCFNTTIRDPYISAPTTSFFRYYMSLFPIYLSIGILPKIFQLIIMSGMICLSYITTLLFATGIYFY